MNDTSSGVAISAAKIRSPSFSRSSSSTTTTALPALMSARARSIASNGLDGAGRTAAQSSVAPASPPLIAPPYVWLASISLPSLGPDLCADRRGAPVPGCQPLQVLRDDVDLQVHG